MYIKGKDIRLMDINELEAHKSNCSALISKIYDAKKYFSIISSDLTLCESQLKDGAIIDGKPFRDGEIKEMINIISTIDGYFSNVSRECSRMLDYIDTYNKWVKTGSTGNISPDVNLKINKDVSQVILE